MGKVRDIDIFLKNMNKKELVIFDMNNKEYRVNDIERFIEHINEYHNSGSSIHEENGYYFLVDDNFRLTIRKFLDN